MHNTLYLISRAVDLDLSADEGLAHKFGTRMHEADIILKEKRMYKICPAYGTILCKNGLCPLCDQNQL